MKNENFINFFEFYIHFQTWREVFVSQLRANLSEAHVKGLSINLSYIIYNMTNVSSRGVVQLASDKSNDLPRWYAE